MPPFDRDDTTISDVLERIIDALERSESEDGTPFYVGTGRIDRPFRMDYDFDVQWGLDSDLPPTAEPDSPATEPDYPTAEPEGYLVDARRTDDEMVVVADLPDVDSDDVTVRIAEDHRLLEIGTDEGVIERIPLPWPADVRRTRLNNGVLDVTIVPIRGGDDE